MKFLDWLLGGEQKPAPTPLGDLKIFEEVEPAPREFKTVPKWTHPGNNGKTIYCPKCMHDVHVGHFSWTAMSCPKCKASAGKYEWLLRVENK